MGDQGRGDLPWWLLNVAVLSRVGTFLLLWIVCALTDSNSFCFKHI